MDAKNMPIWAISTGNEPLNGIAFFFFVHFMSLGWIPKNQVCLYAENYVNESVYTRIYEYVAKFIL